MATPTFANTVTLGQTTRTLTGSAIALTTDTTLNASWIFIFNRAGNAAVTVGFNATTLPISLAASASTSFDVTGFEGQRIKLSDIFVSGTNAQVIDVLYIS